MLRNALNAKTSIANALGLRVRESVDYVRGTSVRSSTELSSDRIDREMDVIWTYVSMSREQFITHYVELTQRTLEFTQSEDVVLFGLESAREVLAKSMITKLPHGRSREAGHMFEQVWKFTKYCCELIEAAKSSEVVFVDAKGIPQISINDRMSVIHETLGIDRCFYSPERVAINIDYFLNKTSREWLCFDGGRPLREVIEVAYSKGGAGVSIAINNDSKNGKTTEDGVFKSVENDLDSGEKTREKMIDDPDTIKFDPEPEAGVVEEFVFDPNNFIGWADGKGYVDGELVTLPTLVFQEYIDECLGGQCVEKKDVQQALINLGAVPEDTVPNDPKSKVYVWKI